MARKLATMKIICFFLLILATTISSQNNTCPFQYTYHFGDGFTDIGNSVLVPPYWVDVPAKHLPYGMTYPGWPTGRWSDGLIDYDFAVIDFGLPNIVPYLAMDPSKSYDGVIFSVARSPVLDREFFESRGIKIPPYAVSLSGQMAWFKNFLKSICSTPEDTANRLANSVVFMGDVESNDLGYALSQGKSIEEARTYVPFIIKALTDASRELIKLGATRLIIPGNSPLGCYPYILTALQTNDSTSYDGIGCLKSVNDLVMLKNNLLTRAINRLQREFPDIFILGSNLFDGVGSYINQTSVIGPDGNKALKACCGIGGKYNYDSSRFCGSKGVPVCSNPKEYVFWDGIHLTQEAYYQIEHVLVQPALTSLNCTNTTSLVRSYGTSSGSMSY